MLTLLIFLITLSILVLVHEFGHFAIAKRNGIRVEEFGLGLPPKLYGKKFGETEYTVNLLPFGGFVRLTGEDIEDEDNPDLLKDPQSFISKKPLQRIAVLVAGVTMNIILAVTVFYIFLGLNSFKSFDIPLFFDYNFKFGQMNRIGTAVTVVQEDLPADIAGIELGEAVVEIDGVPISTISELRDGFKGKLDQDVSVVLLDLKDRSPTSLRTVSVKPVAGPNGDEIIGVFVGEFVTLSYDKPYQRVLSGFMHMYNMTAYSLNAFKEIIGFSIDTNDIEPVSQSISGPVGIYQLVGGILQLNTREAALSLLDYIGLMSMSLAVVNMLPIPALDGGRVLFVIIEMIRKGKRLSPRLEMNIHRVGMILLLGLLFLVTIKDIFI